jgi:hypothetical protein
MKKFSLLLFSLIILSNIFFLKHNSYDSNSYGVSSVVPPPNLEIKHYRFFTDYTAGRYDENGFFMGGTEAMSLAGFFNKLYVGIGFANDVPGSDPKPGAQILVKEIHNGNWKVEKQFDTSYLRVECLKKIVIEKDINGNPVIPPKNLLLAAPSGLYSPDIPWTNLWFKEENSNNWIENKIVLRYLGVRAAIIYTDKVTGMQHLFAGLNVGAIYRGTYDPQKPDYFVWGPTSEIYNVGRVLSFTECNGNLYVSTELKDTLLPLKGGVYKRIDGLNPIWQKVYEVPHFVPSIPQSGYIRGLTTIIDPLNNLKQLIILGLEYKGLFVTLDPGNNHKAKTDIDLMQYFNNQWNDSLLNTQGVGAVYNRFTPYFDHATQSQVWLAGVWAQKKGFPNNNLNGSYFVQRDLYGNYKWCYIYDYNNPLPPNKFLTATRDIEISPFTQDSNKVLYFCGFDAGIGPSHNTAWVYKGVYFNPPIGIKENNQSVKFQLFQNNPNPFNPFTKIKFDIPKSGFTELKVFDITGREVKTLVNTNLQPGSYEVQFDGSILSSGVYFYRLTARKFTETKVMVLIK